MSISGRGAAADIAISRGLLVNASRDELLQRMREHIHTVVRTPNGNDYGRDYLRQHYAQFAHVNGQHVVKA